MIGVYKIEFTTLNKVYIGSSLDVESRLEQHRRALIRGNHKNPGMQAAWLSEDHTSVLFQVIEECDESIRVDRETYWVEEHNSMHSKYGFNRTIPYAKAQSPETRRKISEGHKNSEKSKDRMRKLHQLNIGRRLSEETKARMADARRGKPRKKKVYTEDGLRRVREAAAKRVYSEETRRKISEANKGKIMSESARKTISEKNRGQKRTDEQKRRIREGQIAANKVNPRKNRDWSEEERKEVSEMFSKMMKGVPKSEAHRQAISDGHKRRREAKELQAAKELAEKNWSI